MMVRSMTGIPKPSSNSPSLFLILHGSSTLAAGEGGGLRYSWGRHEAPQSINSMAVHAVAMGKLKLLAGGHSNWQLLAGLLGPFALKLPFATRLPTSCADLAFSLRLFLFRLRRIVHSDAAPRRGGRWERALRLLHERAVADDRTFGMLRASEGTLDALSTLAL